VKQTEQNRLNQQLSSRSLQFELVRMALEDPGLRAAMPSGLKSRDGERWRRDAYRNLWFVYLQSQFVVKAQTESGLRRHLAAQFSLSETRQWWDTARYQFEIEASQELQHKFVKIATEECERVNNGHAGPTLCHEAT
jgi:hypothetical protein